MGHWFRILAAIGLAAAAVAATAAPATLYGARGLQFEGNQVEATRDGGSVVVGTQSVARLGVLVMRFDPQGRPLWTRLLELPGGHVSGLRVREAPDGFVVLALVGLATDIEPWDMLVAKLDAAGTVQWQRVFQGGGTSGFLPEDLAVGADGSSVIAATQFGASQPGWLARLAPDGSVAWQQTLSTSVGALQMLPDGGTLAAAGGTLLQLDAAGQPISIRSLVIDGTGATIGAIRPWADGWLLTGWIGFGEFGARPWLLRVDAGWAPLWSRLYSAPGCGELMLALDARPMAGGILLTTQSAFCGDTSVAKLDATGALLWQGTQDYVDLDPVMHVLSYAPAPDGGFVATGTVADFDLPVRLLMMRADAAGNLERCRAVKQHEDRLVVVPVPPVVQWQAGSVVLSPDATEHAPSSATSRSPRLQTANACRL